MTWKILKCNPSDSIRLRIRGLKHLCPHSTGLFAKWRIIGEIYLTAGGNQFQYYLIWVSIVAWQCQIAMNMLIFYRKWCLHFEIRGTVGSSTWTELKWRARDGAKNRSRDGARDRSGDGAKNRSRDKEIDQHIEKRFWTRKKIGRLLDGARQR